MNQTSCPSVTQSRLGIPLESNNEERNTARPTRTPSASVSCWPCSMRCLSDVSFVAHGDCGLAGGAVPTAPLPVAFKFRGGTSPPCTPSANFLESRRGAPP